jgi:hypothetical protein
VGLGGGQFLAGLEIRHQSRIVGDKGAQESRVGATFTEMSSDSWTALERFLSKAITHD